MIAPLVLEALGAALGLAGGVLAGRLADTLPGRYGITHGVSGAARTKRNVTLAVLTSLVGLGLGPGLGAGLADVSEASAGGASPILSFAVSLVLVAALFAASAVDLEHMILPDELTLGGAALALLTSPWRGTGLVGAISGAALGLLASYVPHLVYKRLRGQSGQGLGDTKLLVMAGAWQGVTGALFVLFAGAVQAVLASVVMRALGLRYAIPQSVKAEIAELRARADAGDAEARELLADDPMAAPAASGLLATRLPLGPFLALGCVELLFARRSILALFEQLLMPTP